MKSLTVEKIEGYIVKCQVFLTEIQNDVSKGSFNERTCEKLLELQKLFLNLVILILSLPADYEIEKLCQERKENYDKHKDHRGKTVD